MTLQECTALMVPLALALRVDLDDPTFRAYHRVLKDVPAVLVDAALSELSKGGLTFYPTAPEILAASEKERRRQLAANPYDGCIECEDQRGYRSILGSSGQKTVEPCPCKQRHRERLARMGVLDEIALLPGEAGIGENEKIYPTLAQLPPKVQAQLRQVAGRKVIR